MKMILLLAALISFSATAQNYPTKPVRVIMTVGAGGDPMTRLIGQRIGEAIGQPFVTEIQSAAGGSIGSLAVARAAPDGHTLLLTAAASQVMRVFLVKNLAYDPLKDLTPIADVVTTVTAVAAHPSLPASTVDGLIEHVRRNPGKISYGSSGVGTSGHLSMELIESLTKIQLVHVPYKSGSQSVVDLIGGQILVSMVALPPVLAHVKSGKLKLLAMNSSERFRLMPNVPTVSEQVAGYESLPAWVGYFGPADLPDAITRRLNTEMNNAVRAPEVREKLEPFGFVATGTNSPAQFAATMRRDMEQIGKIVKAAQIQPE